MVIVAIPSSGEGGLNESMNPRFGRCPSFTLVTIENGEIKEVRGVPNNAANSMGGAGIQAAQTIGNNGAEEVIVGFLGPNAAESLNAMNLKIYQAPNQQLTVKDVVDLYLEGSLQELDSANVGAHHGMGGGMGMGSGMGGGRRRQF
ncbi:MAG: NifB/NifX family molybdenum-iron cluster-binding protein [Promethearchaeota archaeon]